MMSRVLNYQGLFQRKHDHKFINFKHILPIKIISPFLNNNKRNANIVKNVGIVQLHSDCLWQKQAGHETCGNHCIVENDYTIHEINHEQHKKSMRMRDNASGYCGPSFSYRTNSPPIFYLCPLFFLSLTIPTLSQCKLSKPKVFIFPNTHLYNTRIFI